MPISRWNILGKSPVRRRQQRNGSRLALWSVLLALLPLFLIVYGVQVMRQASLEDADVNISGSLRFRSLLLYGLTHQNLPNEPWRPALTTMETIRTRLRLRYPVEVSRSDADWNRFSTSLRQSGRVDWQTALQMRDAADRLTQAIEATAEKGHDRATDLFLAGIAATVACVLLVLMGTLHSRRAEQEQAEAEEALEEAKHCAELEIAERKQVSERLAAVTMLQQAILDSADYSLISTDVQGTIVTWNRSAERMLGYSAQDVVGKVTPAIVHAPDEVIAYAERLSRELNRTIAPGFEVFVSKTEDGTPDENEWTYLRKDGSRFPVRLSVTPLRNPDGVLTGYLGVAQDITAQKASEQELRDNEERLREAQHVARIGSWELNIVSESIRWSEEMFRLFRFDAAEGVPALDRLLARIHPEDRERYRRTVATANQVGEHYELDLRLVFEDGDLMWGRTVGTVECDTAGHAVRRYGTFMDVTVQKQAEMELLKSREKLTLAQQVAQVGSWEYDLATDKIVWSPEMFRLLDLDPKQGALDYAAYLALYHPDDAAALDVCMRRGFSAEIEYEMDLRRTVEDGAPQRWYHALGRPIKAESGKLVRLVGTLQDITARKRVEHELEQAYLQLERQMTMLNEQAVELEAQRAELEEANLRLKALSLTDGLTGLNNHRAFQEILAAELERHRRYQTPVSIVLLDVDSFKSYNDTYGHPEGDAVLKMVAQTLRATARDIDAVCRYGGEEFVIVLPNADIQGAVQAAERFRTAIEGYAWPRRAITASFGVSTLATETITDRQLVTCADTALYESKAKGRNCVTHFVNLSL